MGAGEPVIGYARVSTTDQGINGIGLEAQRRMIQAECAHRGWHLLRIEEDILSGKSMRRPGLARALEACRTGTAAGVVAAKLDRLTRSVVDLGQLLEQAKKYGYNLVALDFGLDLSTPQGELVANVLASVAQWERRMIGQRTREALAVKKADGMVLGRPRVLPQLVRERIVAMREGGQSLGAIASELNMEGTPTAHGGRQWYPSTIRAVLGG